jgi:hypothetical protein
MIPSQTYASKDPPCTRSSIKLHGSPPPSNFSIRYPNNTLKTKLRGLSPQANYTDRVTAALGEVVPTFADRGVLRGQRNGSPRR